jgi:hypothetical protein
MRVARQLLIALEAVTTRLLRANTPV